MKVKDLMIPIGEYATINSDGSLYDALIALRAAQKMLPAGAPPHRAVLVEDESGFLIGRIGLLTFIKALGTEFTTARTRKEMNRAGISPESISTVVGHLRFLQTKLGTLRERAMSIKARDVMHPVRESISEDASIQDAIDLFGTWQTLSILVKRAGDVVGILRVSELFQAMENQILSPETNVAKDK
jgi:CBS domain-containing protein